MAYSKYEIRRKCAMTFGEVVVLMALGALLVGGVASSFRVRPLAIFVAACVPSAFVLVIAEHETREPCERAGIGGVSGAVAEIAVVLALVLWEAAAVTGVVKGIQLAKAGRHDAALARYLGCPLAGAFGAGVVFVAFLSAALHCMD
jgi:hypothetical protein